MAVPWRYDSFRSSYTMILLPILLLVVPCVASPVIMVNSGKAKCFSIEAVMDTIVRVTYEAPDLIVDKQDPGFGPAYITINVRPTGRVLDTKLHTAPINTRLRPTSELIDATKGSVSHKIETDGEANICVRASSASIANPMRFSLRVIEVTSDPKYDAKGEELHVDEHLSHVEVELNIIKAGMTHILMNADQAKNRDGLFHKQAQDMLDAMVFWPVVHVIVLLATAFAQASHIVRFFKSRRII